MLVWHMKSVPALYDREEITAHLLAAQESPEATEAITDRLVTYIETRARDRAIEINRDREAIQELVRTIIIAICFLGLFLVIAIALIH
jgi:hypothetical protein